MSILLITNILIKKERNLLFMELLSTAISYLNTYLLEKFSQKKYSTKLLVIFTITFLSFMLWQIYSGYSKALKLTSIIVSLPLISLISELIIPTFLSLFFISIIKNQVKEKMTQNKRLYYFKVSCCLQVYFYVLYFILIKLITKIKYNFCMFISMLILFFVLLLFASLYFKNNWIAKNIDKKYGLCLTLVLYILYGICIMLLFNDKYFAIITNVYIFVLSFFPFGSIGCIDTVNIIKQADKEKLKEIFVSLDSPFFCMFTIIVVTTFISFFSIFNFGELGENALSFENTYTKIESPIKFQSHKDADGYLLFKTINQKNIALAYKKCDKKGNISKNSKGNYIKILKGYKYIDLDSLEVSEQNYTIKVNK